MERDAEFGKLINLKEMLEIIKLIAKSKDIHELDVTTAFDNKVYDIHKFLKREIDEKSKDIKEGFTIECSDGRKIIFTINLQAREDYYDRSGPYWFCDNYVSIEYILSDRYKITFISNISSNKIDYNGVENISEEKFYDSLMYNHFTNHEKEVKCGRFYHDTDYTDFSLDFSMLENRAIKFVVDNASNVIGIYSNNPNYRCCLLSSDGKQILSLNQKIVPSLEEIEEFDVEKEIAKLKKLLEDNQFYLSPTTIKILEKDQFQSLRNKANKFKKIKNEGYGTIIPIYNKFMELRNSIINALNNRSFSQRELMILVEFLGKIIEQKQKEMDEELEILQTPEGKAKRLIKNLSQDELNALRNEINKK